MASCMGCLLGCMFIVSALLLQGTAAQTIHIVGGSLGWTVPPPNFSYDSWAANQTFMVGNWLQFNFSSGLVHDVTEFSKADYESCNNTNPITYVVASSVNFLIETAGEHYYFCTFKDYCEKNMKLAIKASGTPIWSPPPPPSSASSLTVGGFSLLLLAIYHVVI
ncbi:umecyanin-like [Telopea speciosissima]|uniref:umecyanin-like n=1 Tax=Telopea speciosissima TaxID=54955 RepID=UPI001CC59726|nr:umecyanin-like [Telopea speciosissima]